MTPSDSIEETAPTVDEAVRQALAKLGAQQDDVTIEVLSTPRSGVLGLGARPARVRVTRRAPAGARSGVMSPPPAPPLRATPPEMRRPEAPPREEPGDAPRKEQRGQAANVSDALPREDRRDPTGNDRSAPPANDRREPPRDAAGGPARQERGERRPERSDTPRQPPRRVRSEPQGHERSEVQGQDRRTPARTAPRPSAPDERGDGGARDDRDAREGRDEQRDNGRAEGAPRSGRGRAGGPARNV